MIPKQIQTGFFSGVRQVIIRFTWKNIQGRIAGENSGKPEQYWVGEKEGKRNRKYIYMHCE